MPAVLQIHFPFDGPFGAAMSEFMVELATSINEEPGLRWKLWTESPERRQAGGVYLFDDIANAELYERLPRATERPSILAVLRNLQEVSQKRHLPAFQRCAEGRQADGRGRGGERGHGVGKGRT